jgi:N-acetylmuramoyl-L-alanine amidase
MLELIMKLAKWLSSPMPTPKEEKVVFEFTRPTRKVETVFIHCSASDHPSHDDVSVMRKWHKKRGFNDVGYNYYIKKDGTIQEGRPVNKIPAAQKGHNRGSIAICVGGLAEFTDDSLEALKMLCRAISSEYGNAIIFRGHREVANKTCPVFDYKAVLNLDNKGKMKWKTK